MKSIFFSFNHHKRSIALLLLCLFFGACAPSISLFNERAYEQAVELKVTSLQLMDHASQPFEEHREAIAALKTELRKAYEFAKGRPGNEYSTEQWEIMTSPDRHMLGGFLKRWEEAGSLPEVFVREAKINIAAGFDTIIGLESGKIKPE